MKLLYLLGRFPVPYERPIHEEMAALVQRGADVYVAALHADPAGDPGAVPELTYRCRFLDVGRSLGRVPGALLTSGAGMMARLRHPIAAGAYGEAPAAFESLTRARRLRLDAICRRDRPDLMHVQFGHLALLALPVVEVLRLPLVVSFRGQDVHLVSCTTPVDRRRLFDKTARVFVRSEDMGRDLRDLGCPTDRLHVVPTGIDLLRWEYADRRHPEKEGDVVLLAAGRLVPKKGIDLALRALAACRAGADGPRLRVAGDGPERERLETLAGELGLTGRVDFLGKVSLGTVQAEMQKAHIFLLPSRTAGAGEKEGIPNAIKEAMASGLPVLATEHAGIPECVAHGESGFLVPEEDAEALATRLDEMLAHPEMWTRMGRRGREIVERRFDVNAVAQSLLSHYDEILVSG